MAGRIRGQGHDESPANGPGRAPRHDRGLGRGALGMNARRNGHGRKDASLGTKPLLSVEEVAILLGETRSTLYRALAAGTLPLPVYIIGARRRIPRRAV